jgi:hypothetical protein
MHPLHQQLLGLAITSWQLAAMIKFEKYATAIPKPLTLMARQSLQESLTAINTYSMEPSLLKALI